MALSSSIRFTHAGFAALPRRAPDLLGQSLADGSEHVVASILGASKSTSGRRRAASAITCWTSHHEIPNAKAVSDTARPEVMAASSTDCRSRSVDRARHGTCGVALQNYFRSHRYTSQKQRRLSQSISARLATGTSHSRWNRRSFTRNATTPQCGQPGVNVVSIVMWRAPSGSKHGADETVNQALRI